MMAFYNDYRPRQFDQVLGQDQAISILKKQAGLKSFHHAYLFFGSSGTGKTTTARILACCLNCDSLDGTGEPCGECRSCKAILGSKSWDVLELDGARYRGIDDVKELAYKANFAPMGNKKVYIIDECQMLSDPAWNGLLKLLEEPPPHLAFILCTTDLAKIPETIASRCQLYPFKKMKPEDIKSKVEMIARGEGIPLDERHAEFIAQTSGGNMRKGENLLEQCLVIERG